MESLKVGNMVLNKTKSSVYVYLIVFLFSFASFSQVKSSIDSTKIKIGEQIIYKIEVETNPGNLVVFPEGQTFMPLEMVDSYPVDTIKNKDKYNLIKKYGLTQFDSGSYTIPRQKIIIRDKTFLTDSLKVEVNTVVVDTLKQGLYDIKPIIEVKEMASDWWKYLLYILLALTIIGGLLYWFIWRKKPLSEAEKIALLPPYDRAKLALKKLDESNYLENEAIKEYYSELTFIIRRYLDEKVYDRALESTTDELIYRLNLLKEGNQIDLSIEDIVNLERILKRADLVKFAKSAPDIELAKFDRNTIDIEIDHVKQALPEPTEEEKLLDEKYKEQLKHKAKRKKIIVTVSICVFLLLATLTGFSIKYGFGYVKDTIIGHDTKELLEGDWVTSEYGFPPITISTPKVLKREAVPSKDVLQNEEGKIASHYDAFYYGSLLSRFYILTRSVPADPKQLVGEIFKNNPAKLEEVSKMDEDKLKEYILFFLSEEFIKVFENAGAKNIFVKKEKYETPEFSGIKTEGNFTGINAITKQEMNYDYQIYLMAENNAIQTVVFTYQKDDKYVPAIIERVVNSIKLKKAEE